ncbi:MAG: YlbF family regulator [Desulfosporosinus sp.]
MNSEIGEKAELLAAAIAQSLEGAELQRCEEAMKADESAQRLIAELEIAYQRFMEIQQSNGFADKTEVAEIETKMDRNPTIVAYTTAQDAFQEMLQGVKTILDSAIARFSGGSSGQDDTRENTYDTDLMRSQAGVMTEEELQKLIDDYMS